MAFAVVDPQHEHICLSRDNVCGCFVESSSSFAHQVVDDTDTVEKESSKYSQAAI